MLSMNSFRDNLLDVEPISPGRRQQFREELSQIIEPRLSPRHRSYYTMSLMGTALGIPGAICGLLLDSEHRSIWVMNLLIFVPMVAWLTYILRRDAEPLRMMQSMSKVLVGVSVAASFASIYLGLQNPSLTSILWALLGVLVFLLMSSINLWNRVIIGERCTREQILRLEYQIADLAASVREDRR